MRRKTRFLAIFLTLALLCSCNRVSKDNNTSATSLSAENSSSSESTIPATPTPTPLPTDTPTPSPTPEPTPTEIKISFIGDTTLGEQRVHMGQSYCFTSVVGDNFEYLRVSAAFALYRNGAHALAS